MKVSTRSAMFPRTEA